MAKLDRIANRYAKAAFDYLKDGGKAEKTIEELQNFSKVLESSADLKQALTNEGVSTANRVAVLSDISAKLGLSDSTKRILTVLAENRRLGNAGAVGDRLHTLHLEAQSVAHLSVETPVELSDAEKKQIEKKFTDILGKKVEASYVLEPHLLGGLKVTAAGRTYDGTLSGWLGALEEKLIGGRI